MHPICAPGLQPTFGHDKGLATLMQSTFILQDDLFNENG